MLWLLVVLITIPVNRLEVNANIQKFHAVEKTVEIARKKEREEVVAVILKIAEMNQWLASTKYYRKKFMFWYPEEIKSLKPIE